MKATIKLNLPSIQMSQQIMAQTGLDMVSLIKVRIYKGLDANGKPFKPYSIKPLYVSKGSPLARRLAPKGGIKTKKGMFFAGGYREYKEKSRKRSNAIEGQTAEVDLTLSGMMMQNFTVLKSSDKGFTIGLLPPVESYGYAVNAQRQFIGLTDDEINKLIEMIKINLMGES